ncbi:MAG: hypothetical protein EXQ59_01940 [Acidobacteria bacterium]|nr:hypothetical protein [Acidobacteriota bacterium]
MTDQPSNLAQLCDGVARSLDSVLTAVAAVQADLEAACIERDAACAALQAERDRAGRAEAELLRATEEFELSLGELRQEHATLIDQHQVASTSLPLDQLLIVFASMKRASTYPDVLTALVDGLARELSRVVLFEVQGSRLQGLQQRGLEVERDIATIAIVPPADSLLGRALSSGRLEVHVTNARTEGDSTLPFGGTPSCALAIPISIADMAPAVIYADDSDRPEFATGASWARAKFAELLQQHALLELVRIAVEQKALAEYREYAVVLVNEIEFAHTADADAGRSPLERQQRIRDDLGSARRIFAQRTAGDGIAAAEFLEQRLVETVETRGESSFASDMAAVIGVPSAAASARVVMMFR